MKLLMSDKVYVRITNGCLFGIALIVLVAQHLPPANWIAPTFIGLSAGACLFCVGLYLARGGESERARKRASNVSPSVTKRQQSVEGQAVAPDKVAGKPQVKQARVISTSSDVASLGDTNLVDVASALSLTLDHDWRHAAPATVDMSLDEIIQILGPVSVQRQLIFRRNLYAVRRVERLFDSARVGLAADYPVVWKKSLKPLEKTKSLTRAAAYQEDVDACLA